MQRITVTQLQFRNALIDLSLYSQWDSNFSALASEKGLVYYRWSPMIDSDSEYFTDENTAMDPLQRYAVFLLAQTL